MARVRKTIVGNEQIENSVIELLCKKSMAVSTDFVAFHLEIGWSTARSLLLRMALDKKIEAEKTTRGLIWRPKKEAV